MIRRLARYRQLIVSGSGVALLAGGAIAAQFLSEVLLARAMAKDAYGVYSFIRQSMVLVVAFAFLGLDQALVRHVAKQKLADFDWKHTFAWLTAVSGAMTAALVVFIVCYYRISGLELTVIAVGSVLLLVQQFMSSLWRADHRFFLGQLAFTGYRFVFLVAVAVAAVREFSGVAAGGLLVLTIAASALPVVLIGWRMTANGTRRMDLRALYGDGVLFWCFMASLTLLNSLDTLLLKRLASDTAVGEYTALWTIASAPYLLLQSVIGFIAMPLFVRRTGAPSLPRMLLYVALIAGGILIFSVGYYPLVGVLLRLVYHGKYVCEPTLCLLFLGAGICRVLYIIPSVVLGGKARRSVLLLFLAFALIGVGVHVGLGIMLIPQTGIEGAATASLVNWLIRAGAGVTLSVLFCRYAAMSVPDTRGGPDAPAAGPPDPAP